MGELQSPTPQQLIVESAIFWGIGLVLFILRLTSRSIQGGGIRHLQKDDYILCITFVFYTALMILINASAHFATNLYEPSQEAAILADPQDVSDRVTGSKIVVALEQCMMFSTWGVKTVILTMWFKLTHNVKHSSFVKFVAAYSFIGFLIVELSYFAVWCIPFKEYWSLPVKNPQCATYQRYSITQAVFNISSDLMILWIPLPVFLRLKVPLARRLILISVFSLGFFVVIAAILNKYYNFSNPQTTIYMLWYIRESSTAIYVACILALWPLFRFIFKLTPFGSTSSRRIKAQEIIGNAVQLGTTHYSSDSSNLTDSSKAPLGAGRGVSNRPTRSWRHRLAGNPADISVSAALRTTDSMEQMVNSTAIHNRERMVPASAVHRDYDLEAASITSTTSEVDDVPGRRSHTPRNKLQTILASDPDEFKQHRKE
ncbi:MAG: hypothetical protein M1814_005825 [Vezdaea aestivalis]|nr:MAG: hypothetical protein M1814_005825 [Vezdaea aestivalis]